MIVDVDFDVVVQVVVDVSADVDVVVEVNVIIDVVVQVVVDVGVDILFRSYSVRVPAPRPIFSAPIQSQSDFQDPDRYQRPFFYPVPKSI
jgi:hypothetical protein